MTTPNRNARPAHFPLWSIRITSTCSPPRAGDQAADETLNRELDALRQRRYRNCEPDLEYAHAEFERLCRSEIAATIAAAIPSTKQHPKNEQN